MQPATSNISIPPKPQALRVQSDTIPSELRGIPQWVLWRWEYREGEGKPWTKPPHQPSGAYTDATKPSTWVTFEVALAAYQRGGFDGIGLVLTEALGIVGVDLDSCRDPQTGAIEAWAISVCERLDSVTEVSPSGTGLRIWIKAKLPPERRKRGAIEMYSGARFLAVTGHPLPNSLATIMERQEQLEAWRAELWPPQPKAEAPASGPTSLPDSEIIEHARRAKNGDRFAGLWDGDISDYPSPSEADLALCSHLAFWTGGDASAIDRLFRRSGLFREKWGERHGASTYGQLTIAKALEGTHDYYKANTTEMPRPQAGRNGHQPMPMPAPPDSAPWPSPLEANTPLLGELLGKVRNTITRYVVLNGQQADAVALWTAHAHAFAAAETTPYMSVRSAEKRSGKSRLLEVLENLVPKPLKTENISVAALVHSVDEGATLLLDEVDSVFGKGKASETQEMLRGILDSGYRVSGSYVRMVGQGAAMAPRRFKTFSPKVLSGMGKLPGTLDDRSVIIEMKRKAPNEHADRFRYRDAKKEASPIREGLAVWAQAAIELLRDARPDIPTELDDRAADGWEPMLAIADMAGGVWPRRARDAALVLSAGEVREDESIGVRLLADIKTAFAATREDRLSTAALLKALNETDDAPWGGFHDGGGMKDRDLAGILRKYGIRPKQIKFEDGGRKGYEREVFKDSFSRYVILSETRETTGGRGPLPSEANSHPVSDKNTASTASLDQVSEVSDGRGVPAEEEVRL